MKKILFIAICLLSVNNINAQNTPNFNDYVPWMDSLKIEYSVKKFVNLSQINYDYERNFGNLSISEQNLLINKIEDLYKQQEYVGLYCLAGCYLDRFHRFSIEQKIRERLTEIYFDKICYMSSKVVDFGQPKYYTQYTKDRLLQIVEKRWSEEDLKAWSIFIEQNLNIDNYKRDVEKIKKETNRQGEIIEKFLLDSLMQKGIERDLESNTNRPISRWSIITIGSLNDQRFIPALETIIEETKIHKDSSEYKKVCTYALAKLGVQKYIDEILENDKDINWRYLGTTEAFLRWLEINRDWNRWIRLSSEASLPAPIVSLWEAQRLDSMRGKVPKELIITAIEFESFCLPGWKNCDSIKVENSKLTIQKVDKLYQWFLDNKDMLVLPPASDIF